MKDFIANFKCFLRAQCSRRSGLHPDGDIMIFSTARSGSTWVKEIIASQKNIKFVSEPLLMDKMTRRQLGAEPSWQLTIPCPQRERILRAYFQRQFEGSCGYGTPGFTSEFYRFKYDRVVLKLLRCHDMMQWFADTFGVKIVYLLRHPIPVALSREEYKRLPLFLESSQFREQYLSDKKFDFCVDILRKGSALEQKVLDWCLQNLAPLKHLDSSRWLTIHYEDIVLDAEQQLQRLTSYLNLQDAGAVEDRINRASASTYKSDAETQHVLTEASDVTERKSFLVNKWLTRVNDEDQKHIQSILDHFEIDTYRADSALPVKRLNYGSSL